MKKMIIRLFVLIIAASTSFSFGNIDDDLIDSAADGDIEAVQSLIDKGADVNARDVNEWTALHHAAEYGYPDIARLLIQNGADVNAREMDEWTPLHLAASGTPTRMSYIRCCRLSG